MINQIIINETWEYWAEKFKGMSKEEIDQYWQDERDEANSEISIEMDSADESPGIRAQIVRDNYDRYQTAKSVHEGKEPNKFETWEYWAEKFKGMSKEEIDQYWQDEQNNAISDLYKKMDAADGVPGIHSRIIETQYKRYISAKKMHETILEESKKASLNGVSKELDIIGEAQKGKSQPSQDTTRE